MRVILDTNVAISGLLWGGPPHRLIDAAIEGAIEIFTSSVLLTELREVLAYAKLAKRMAETDSSVDSVVDRYVAIAQLTAPARISPTVIGDPDDDHVLACAIAAQAELIVIRDTRLLNLHVHGIPIVPTAEAVRRIRMDSEQ
jgi:putative PIN family toxin of toxin-antitoxin system